MEWRKVCSLTYQGLSIHDNFDIQNQTGCIYSVDKSKHYQLDLDDKSDIELQDEKYRMTITQKALVREFLVLSYKVNHDEWNYIGHWESYEGYDSTYEVTRH
jgi:2-phospho-L-lactate guanylyltransferase (CobY/MobA/RfbA family)